MESPRTKVLRLLGKRGHWQVQLLQRSLQERLQQKAHLEERQRQWLRQLEACEKLADAAQRPGSALTPETWLSHQAYVAHAMRELNQVIGDLKEQERLVSELRESVMKEQKRIDKLDELHAEALQALQAEATHRQMLEVEDMVSRKKRRER